MDLRINHGKDLPIYRLFEANMLRAFFIFPLFTGCPYVLKHTYRDCPVFGEDFTPDTDWF